MCAVGARRNEALEEAVETLATQLELANIKLTHVTK